MNQDSFEKLELPSGKIVLRYQGDVKNKHAVEASRIAQGRQEYLTFAFMAVLLRDENGHKFMVEDVLEWPITDTEEVMKHYPGVFS